jgi:hypothetical protein
MAEIHCHTCGGFIGNVDNLTYREPADQTPQAAPRSGPCTCDRSVVFGPPPGYMSWPGISVQDLHRIASRN